MARRSRRSIAYQPSQRDISPVTRAAAGSRSLSYWTDLPQSRPELAAPASVPQRGKRRAAAPIPPGARKRASEPVSWGEWTLPPTFPKQTLQKALTCARRAIRREVLFAKRQTGAGSKGWKKHFSNRSCK